ncbi:NADPH2:quinone reductase [Christiangramia gaetbulicola]|uniref:NADPH2:quinone reductase n=1 Tax=Christiangramia gaetbulicola TaxID=703340 RepID=A0A2T6AGT5_9FLAO|nr:quinone oxidoreductase [Christiangramia gaetbulicola]PTX42992.1 NADPH2:quinone reductase [Christiangramia gaetbulicola]
MMNKKMKALTFSNFGGPEVMEYIEVERPVPSKNEVLIETKAIGLNYADIYRRKGNYHLKGKPPYIPGYEAAGVIVESKSERFKVGQRIAFADVPFANAEYIVVPEEHVVPLRDSISFETAASIMLQGLTAHYLANDSYAISADECVLVHAASGGVGQILSQIINFKGGHVIGLTRNEDKLNTILNSGAEYALILDETWKNRVFEIAGPQGVDVVYDSVGITLMDSFDVTRETGTVVFYGMSGGDPKKVDPRMLMDSSKTLTGGDLWGYLKSSEERIKRSNILFDMIEQGNLKIKDPVKFKLSEGRKAHEYLETGQSSSKVLLIP